MEIVKKTEEYTIFKKKSGRYGVRSKHKSWINGDDKITILVKEGLIKAPAPKAKEEKPEENTEAESVEEPGEESSTEASAPAPQEEATN